MQPEDVLDELPTPPHERAEVIEYLLGMIERMNQAIQRHESYPERDELTIEGFTDRRNKYVGQLALLINQYGLVVQLPPTQQTA